MSSVNKAIILGRVGQDPKIATMQSGDKVANLSIATSESWKDKATGEKKEKVDWHNIVVWGNLAGIVEKFVKKGSRIYVQGQLRTRKWTDTNGADKYTTEVVLQGFGSELILLDGKSSDGADASEPTQHDTDKQNGYAPESVHTEEEIPL